MPLMVHSGLAAQRSQHWLTPALKLRPCPLSSSFLFEPTSPSNTKMYTLLTILLTAGTAAAAAAASAASGEPCSKLHNSTAVEPSPNTLEAFKSEKAYDNFASNVPVPLGYDSAFKNFNASVDSNAYLLYENLDSYDVEACADLCDKTRGCRACMWMPCSLTFLSSPANPVRNSQHLLRAQPLPRGSRGLPQPQS